MKRILVALAAVAGMTLVSGCAYDQYGYYGNYGSGYGNYGYAGYSGYYGSNSYGYPYYAGGYGVYDPFWYGYGGPFFGGVGLGFYESGFVGVRRGVCGRDGGGRIEWRV